MLVFWKGVFVTLFVSGLIENQIRVEAHANGLDIAAACAQMIPFHGAAAQTTPCPFKVSFTPDNYTPGTDVTVTIQACTSTKLFAGFLIQARRATTGSDQAAMLGSFTPVANTIQTCSGKGLIHSDNSKRTSLTFKWTPPATAQGHVQFWVTFVQSKVTFWEPVKSDVLRDSSKTLNLATVTPATTVDAQCASVTPPPTLPTGHFLKGSACNDATTCFSDCGANGCTFQISFRKVGTFGEYSIKTKAVGTADMYAAVGFSSDKIMGDDSVSGCIYKAAGVGSTEPFNAKNTGKRPPTMLASTGTTIVSSSMQDSIFSCTFQREIAAGLSGDRFDISLSWYLLFARGVYENDAMNYHAFRIPSADKYSLTGSGSSGTVPPQTTQPPVAGNLVVPSECGSTKGCLSKCSGSSCNTVITWKEDGANVVYTISSVVSSTSSWIAIGLSSDDDMGGDSVLGCASDSSGNVVKFTGQNTGKSPPTLYDDSEVILKDSSFKDKTLSCTLQRPKAASADGKRFDLSKRWYILFARGSASVTGQTVVMSFHNNNMFPSPSKYTSSDMPNAGATTAEHPVVKAHGSLMIAAWIFFASIGIVAARYYKPVWTENLCSQKVWFQLHRTCMIMVFCATVAGFVLIFVEMGHWSDLNEEHAYLETHPILGVIVTALTVLNPVMAFFRPHPGTEKRAMFNWAHWFVGTAAHILGVITIFFGIQLRKAQVPDYLVYVLAGYVAWQVLVELILEIAQCCGRSQARQEVYDMDNVQSPKADKATETEKTLSFKRVLLLIHVFVVTSASAVLIGILCVGEENLK